jgi:hypothetical protein
LQEAWLRLSRPDDGAIDNLGGFDLTANAERLGHSGFREPTSEAAVSTATGIRTRVSAVRGRRPSPLDDSGV